MAQILSSEVLSDSPQADGRRYVRTKFVAEDNNSGTRDVFHGPRLVASDYDVDAWMVAYEPEVLNQLEQKEQERLRIDASPIALLLHNDLGGFYEKKTLSWGTWDDQTIAWLKYYLSLSDQLQLINIQLDVAQISNTDMRNLLDITNQEVSAIRADIQIAVDTQASLDLYTPYFEGGEF